jgi:hypothetical protein
MDLTKLGLKSQTFNKSQQKPNTKNDFIIQFINAGFVDTFGAFFSLISNSISIEEKQMKNANSHIYYLIYSPKNALIIPPHLLSRDDFILFCRSLFSARKIRVHSIPVQGKYK